MIGEHAVQPLDVVSYHTPDGLAAIVGREDGKQNCCNGARRWSGTPRESEVKPRSIGSAGAFSVGFDSAVPTAAAEAC